MSSVIAIIQARLGSTRLPNKVLLQIPPESGVSMLEMIVRKVLLATMVDDVCVVTPDQKIADLCMRWAIDAFMPTWEGRDVVREYYEAAKLMGADVIVRITGDTPLTSPEIIDDCIKKYTESDVDLLYNSEGSFNDGVDVECFSYDALKQAYYHAQDEEREHVCLYMRRNLRAMFYNEHHYGEVESVDTYEEYLVICRLLKEK